MCPQRVSNRKKTILQPISVSSDNYHSQYNTVFNHALSTTNAIVTVKLYIDNV